MPWIGGRIGKILNWLRVILDRGHEAGVFKQKDDRDAWKKR